jgi:hypothetical protein
MKRLFGLIFSMMISVSAFAADDNQICRQKTLTMLVLQKNVDGSVVSIDSDKMIFTVEYDYDLFAGTRDFTVSQINGYATCNDIDVKSAPDGSSSNAGTAEPGDANTFLRASTGDTGVNCWCAMDGPATSWLAFLKTYDSADECAENCTSYCANGMAKNTEMSNGRQVRNAIFDAVW